MASSRPTGRGEVPNYTASLNLIVKVLDFIKSGGHSWAVWVSRILVSFRTINGQVLANLDYRHPKYFGLLLVFLDTDQSQDDLPQSLGPCLSDPPMFAEGVLKPPYPVTPHPIV